MSEDVYTRAEDILDDIAAALAMNRYGTRAFQGILVVALLWPFTGIGFVWFCVACAVLLIFGGLLKLGARCGRIRLVYNLTPRAAKAHQTRLEAWRLMTKLRPDWWREKRDPLVAVTANVDVLPLRRNDVSLLLLPDKLVFVRKKGGGKNAFGVLDFAEFAIRIAFIHTYSLYWRYARKDGGPDRRYKNNERLRREGRDYVQMEFWLGPTLNLGSVSGADAPEMHALAKAWERTGFLVETTHLEKEGW